MERVKQNADNFLRLQWTLRENQHQASAEVDKKTFRDEIDALAHQLETRLVRAFGSSLQIPSLCLAWVIFYSLGIVP